MTSLSLTTTGSISRRCEKCGLPYALNFDLRLPVVNSDNLAKLAGQIVEEKVVSALGSMNAQMESSPCPHADLRGEK